MLDPVDNGVNNISPSRSLDEIYLKSKLRVIPDWPKKGVNFIDITTLLKDAAAFRRVVDILSDHFAGKNVDAIVGIEARGFIIGAAIAYKLGVAFIPTRKTGKLPHMRLSMEYNLEYSSAFLEIHKDGLEKGQRVVIIDDLLATGGSAGATLKLVNNLGAEVVGLGFLVELDFLSGRKRLGSYDIISLVHYDE